MPTYKNETTSPISWGGNFWKPGESKELSFVVPASDLGLTKTADSPAPTHLILTCSGKKTVEAGTPLSIDVPYPARGGKYVLSVEPTEGDVALKIGSGTTGIPLGVGTAWVKTLEWKYAPSITLESAAGATVTVVAEEV